MERSIITVKDFALDVFAAWRDRWFLLTAGTLEGNRFNMMTVAWGSLGVMWNKPFAQVVVRPSRHTHGFMEEYDSFTLCAFPASRKDVLTLCGSRSGRDTDKVQACGLTPRASAQVAAPGFEEAELIIECRKMYYDDLVPGHFLTGDIEPNYGGTDYHRIYFGEILAIEGTQDYSRE